MPFDCLSFFMKTVKGAQKYAAVYPGGLSAQAYRNKQSDGLLHLLALSAVGLCACLICLCGVSWAWFTASTSTGTTQIQSSSYKLLHQVGEDTIATELAETDNTYTLTSDTA